jgi:peptidoglycan lytic transglycosylase G
MGLFDRDTTPPEERTSEERERARAEREARRAQREGVAFGATQPPPAAPPDARVETPAPPPPAAPPDARVETPAPPPQPPDATPTPSAPTQGAPPPAPRRTSPVQPSEPSEPIAAPGPTVHRGPASQAPSMVLDREPVEDWSALDEPPSAARRPRVMGGQSGGIARWVPVVVAGVVGLAVLWFFLALFQPLHGSGEGTVSVTIPRGASVAEAGRRLAQRDVISSAFLFRLRAQLDGVDIKPGAYRLRRGMSYGAALDALSKGPPPAPTTDLTITEGRTRHELTKLLADTSLRGSYAAASRRSAFLDPRAYGAPASTPNLEGFLFPATYQVRVGAPVSELVRKQLTTFKQRFARVDLGYARSKHLTPYDVLIIASMVEREAAVPRDRRLVAAVIYNRLKIGYPLGIDATLRYALNNQTRALRESELRLDSPYNTRIHRGLPPTPIGNPGLAAIEAAAHPAQSRVLYFVVKPGTCGEHAFSTSFQQFQRDAERYSQARAAEGGRSPVKCG